MSEVLIFFFQQSWFYLVIHPAWHFTCWCFWTVALEKTLESPLNCQEIQPVHPKGDQSWVFIWRTDVEAETPILWPPVVKSWVNGKDPDAGKDWGQEEKRTTEDEMVGWHHRLNGRGFGWTLGVGDRQGSLACCGSWGQQRVAHDCDWTELLNKLNKQGESIHPCCTLFPILSQSVVPYKVIIVAPWPAHRFLRKQIRWSGIPVSLRIFQFIVIHIDKGFPVVSDAEVNISLEFPYFLCGPVNVGSLICEQC